MRFMPGSEVSGVRLSKIKTSLKKLSHGRTVMTPYLGMLFGMAEPNLSRFLLELSRLGYLSFDGTYQHTDHWKLGPVGARLVASPIVKPMRRREADKLLEAVIEAAREVSASETAFVVTKLAVFGSYLTKTEELGDLDIAVELAKRPAPNGRNLTAEAQDRAPARADFLTRLIWPQEEVNLMLVAPSRKRVSLHGFDDMEGIQARYRLVFVYNANTGKERRPSDRIRKPDPKNARPEDAEEEAVPGASKACLNPRVDPPASVITGHSPVDRASVGQFPFTQAGLEAQHMWTNGAEIGEILKDLRRYAGGDGLTAETVSAVICRAYEWAAMDTFSGQ